MGRPKERRTPGREHLYTLTVLLDKADLAVLEEAARLDRLSFSDTTRRALRDHARALRQQEQADNETTLKTAAAG